MFLNLFKKNIYSRRLLSKKEVNEIERSKVDAEEEFRKRLIHHQVSLEEVILNAVERKKSSCFYEVIGAENYKKVKMKAISKGYNVKNAGFSRKLHLKDDPNGTFTLEVSW